MENTFRTLGSAETKVVLTFSKERRQIVSVADVRKILHSDLTTRKVIRNLLRKGWLSRIVGGRYMFLPPEHGPDNIGENNILALAAAAVEPSYIGWWSAASWHGFTTQKPMIALVASLRQKLPRDIEGNRVRFIALSKRKFFGFQTYDVYRRSVAVSTPAKTLVDCLDRPDLCGGATELARVVYAALPKVDRRELLENALAMKSKALLQRLGFLSDFVGLPLSEPLREELRAAIPSRYKFHFGRKTRREDDIGYISEWGLTVNATAEALLAELPTGLR